jgi:hypothetical protein
MPPQKPVQGVPGVGHLPPQSPEERVTAAKNAGDRRYASIIAAGGSAKSAWGRASALTSASRVNARIVVVVPRIPCIEEPGG